MQRHDAPGVYLKVEDRSQVIGGELDEFGSNLRYHPKPRPEKSPFAPIILVQPADLFIERGQAAAFSVFATGSKPLRYTWYINSEPVPNNDTPELSLTNVRNTTDVWVDVENAYGAVRSNPASAKVHVPVIIPPSIRTQPSSIHDAIPHIEVTFTVDARGTDPDYQWYADGQPVGTNSSVLKVLADANADYTVEVYNEAGSVTSNVAELRLMEAPIILVQPVAVSAPKGSQATFRVTASGAQMSYQWFRNGTPVGIDSNELVVNATASANFWVVITNPAGHTQSATVHLSIQTVITSQPADTTVAPGDSAMFAVTATGEGLSYQWCYENGTAISGATSSVYQVIGTSGAGFKVKVTGSDGVTVTSRVARLTVQALATRIVTQPVDSFSNTYHPEGRYDPSDPFRNPPTVQFTVGAVGTNLRYQWYCNGVTTEDYDGSPGTSATFVHPRADYPNWENNGDVFTCKVTGDDGVTVTSQPATLHLTPDGTSLGLATGGADAIEGTTGFGIIYYVGGDGLLLKVTNNSGTVLFNGALNSRINNPGTFGVPAVALGTTTYTFELKGADGVTITKSATYTGSPLTISLATPLTPATTTVLGQVLFTVGVTSNMIPVPSSHGVGDGWNEGTYSVEYTVCPASYSYWYRGSVETPTPVFFAHGSSMSDNLSCNTWTTKFFPQSIADNGMVVTCKITAVNGTVQKSVTTTALLTVRPRPPQIVTNPSAVTIDTTQTATFTIGAVAPDGDTLAYQWYRGYLDWLWWGNPISGATSPTLNLSGLSSCEDWIGCVVTGTGGNAVMTVGVPLHVQQALPLSKSFTSVNQKVVDLSFGFLPAGTYHVKYTGGLLKFSPDGNWRIDQANAGFVVWNNFNKHTDYPPEYVFYYRVKILVNEGGWYDHSEIDFYHDGTGEVFVRFVDWSAEDNIIGSPAPTFLMTRVS